MDKEYLVLQLLSKILYQTIFVKSASLVDNFGVLIHRELKLDGAIGDFAEPLWRLKTGHFTTYTVLSFEAS